MRLELHACMRARKSGQPLIGVIGQGSYGVVVAARNKTTGQRLAIKRITPMASDEWDATHTLREIRLMRHLGKHACHAAAFAAGALIS